MSIGSSSYPVSSKDRFMVPATVNEVTSLNIRKHRERTSRLPHTQVPRSFQCTGTYICNSSRNASQEYNSKIVHSTQ